MTVKYLTLNVTVYLTSYNDPMDTSKCFMLVKICSCLYISGNIGKSNLPSIVDLIISPLVHFALMIFVVGRTLLRWGDIAMKFPVHPESATAEFSSFVSCFFVVGSQAILIHACALSNPL